MATLARYYRQDVSDEQVIADYFRQLQFFAFEIVNEAIERIPSVHPSFFPRVGELIAVCQNVVEEVREANKNHERSQRKEWSRVGSCSHVWNHEPEGDGTGLLTGFLVCVNCSKVQPVFNRSQMYSAQKAYLAQALSAEPKTRQPGAAANQ